MSPGDRAIDLPLCPRTCHRRGEFAPTDAWPLRNRGGRVWWSGPPHRTGGFQISGAATVTRDTARGRSFVPRARRNPCYRGRPNHSRKHQTNCAPPGRSAGPVTCGFPHGRPQRKRLLMRTKTRCSPALSRCRDMTGCCWSANSFRGNQTLSKRRGWWPG